MKLDIKEKEIKQPKKGLSILLTVEQLRAKKYIDEWLASHAEFQGEIPWNRHLAEKIENEINVRKREKHRNMVNYKFVLPRVLVERMGRSDREYIEKGYSPNWDDRIRNFLDLLINTYTKQLERILGQDAPTELSNYQKKHKKPLKTRPDEDLKDTNIEGGADHGSR